MHTCTYITYHIDDKVSKAAKWLMWNFYMKYLSNQLKMKNTVKSYIQTNPNYYWIDPDFLYEISI